MATKSYSMDTGQYGSHSLYPPPRGSIPALPQAPGFVMQNQYAPLIPFPNVPPANFYGRNPTREHYYPKNNQPLPIVNRNPQPLSNGSRNTYSSVIETK